MERIFYKPAMKSGDSLRQFQIYIPKEAADALELKDREELKVIVEKTGRVIPAQPNRFKKKLEVENGQV